MHRRFGPAPLFILALALSGCAVAPYEQPVRAFSETVQAANRSLVGYDEALQQVTLDLRRREALKQPAMVGFARGPRGTDCLGLSQRCRISLLSTTGTDARHLVAERNAPRLLAVMEDMNGYAGALAAIIASQSRAQTEAALNDVGKHLEAVIRHAEAADLAPFATPLAGAVGWAAGFTIDAIRFRALQQATETADPIVAGAVKALTAGARVVDPALRAPLQGDVQARMDAFRTSPTAGNLAELMTAADRLDAMLTARPAPVFEQLAASHASLTRALNGREITFAAAQQQIEALRDEVEKIQAVVKAFRKAQSAKEGVSP